MVSLYVTAICYLVDGKPPEEVYECLESQGYLSLSAQSDRGGVISLIEGTVQAFPSNPGFDDELCWGVEAVHSVDVEVRRA